MKDKNGPHFFHNRMRGHRNLTSTIFVTVLLGIPPVINAYPSLHRKVFNSQNGWTYTYPPGAPPTVVQGHNRDFLAQWDAKRGQARVVAVNADTGKVEWDRVVHPEIAPHPIDFSFVSCEGNTLLLANTNGNRSKIVALDCRNGQTISQEVLEGQVNGPAIVTDNGFLIDHLGSGNGNEIQFYSSANHEILPRVPRNILSSVRDSLLIFGGRAVFLEPGGLTKPAFFENADIGPADKLWKLPEGCLIAQKVFGRGYWSDEGADSSAMPHVPDGFSPHCSIVRLYYTTENGNPHFARRWTFESHTGEPHGVLKTVDDIFSFKNLVWLQQEEGGPYFRLDLMNASIEKKSPISFLFAPGKSHYFAIVADTECKASRRLSIYKCTNLQRKLIKRVLQTYSSPIPPNFVAGNAGFFVMQRHNDVPITTVQYIPL